MSLSFTLRKALIKLLTEFKISLSSKILRFACLRLGRYGISPLASLYRILDRNLI